MSYEQELDTMFNDAQRLVNHLNQRKTSVQSYAENNLLENENLYDTVLTLEQRLQSVKYEESLATVVKTHYCYHLGTKFNTSPTSGRNDQSNLDISISIVTSSITRLIKIYHSTRKQVPNNNPLHKIVNELIIQYVCTSYRQNHEPRTSTYDLINFLFRFLLSNSEYMKTRSCILSFKENDNFKDMKTGQLMPVKYILDILVGEPSDDLKPKPGSAMYEIMTRTNYDIEGSGLELQLVKINGVYKLYCVWAYDPSIDQMYPSIQFDNGSIEFFM